MRHSFFHSLLVPTHLTIPSCTTPLDPLDPLNPSFAYTSCATFFFSYSLAPQAILASHSYLRHTLKILVAPHFLFLEPYFSSCATNLSCSTFFVVIKLAKKKPPLAPLLFFLFSYATLPCQSNLFLVHTPLEHQVQIFFGTTTPSWSSPGATSFGTSFLHLAPSTLEKTPLAPLTFGLFITADVSITITWPTKHRCISSLLWVLSLVINI